MSAEQLSLTQYEQPMYNVKKIVLSSTNNFSFLFDFDSLRIESRFLFNNSHCI